MTAAAIGRVSGMIKCLKVRTGLAPSTRIASNSSSGRPLMKLRVKQHGKWDLEGSKGEDDGPVSIVEPEFLVGGEQRGEEHNLGQRQAGQQHPEVDLAPKQPQFGEAVGGEHGANVDENDHCDRNDGAIDEEASEPRHFDHGLVVLETLAGEGPLQHHDEREQVGQDHYGDDDLDQDALPALADLEHHCTAFLVRHSWSTTPNTTATMSRMIESAAP